MKTFMWCYNPNSESGKMLASKLNILRIKHENSTFVGGPAHTVVNWGASLNKWGPKGYGFRVVNNPNAVGIAANKLKFFQYVFGPESPKNTPRIPDYTVDGDTAIAWLKAGHTVVGRQILTGMGGEGIVLMEKPVDFQPCKLYTKYIEKELEYRVYVVAGRVVDYCQKKRKLNETPTNWKIRSRDNGFVYCWPDGDLPGDCATQAIRAVAACGLDFGGVDVIVASPTKGQAGFGKTYVLEVNTAPWLSEYTAELMAKAINEELLAA